MLQCSNSASSSLHLIYFILTEYGMHYLAQNRYFEDEGFIEYLKYLQYWQRPEYIKFIMYPHSLYFLELLQNANFCNAMAHPNNKEQSSKTPVAEVIPETSATPAPPAPTSTSNQMPLPALPPAPTTNVTMTTSSTRAPSPMPYGIAPGSTIPKNEMRNSAVEKRKRK
ncbi:hypothetical protein TanjilG_32367 [Lupinus angustifolius]|uniref:Mediator of RNA polymerase II transcription subunit 31 n=1 Tax=Lupinus angustifolius TaxID=3871 RepID=A0A4P1R0G3_LUPAN|nr:hypothetical protein TanjilG_32367 [Lupinus angustifolius]